MISSAISVQTATPIDTIAKVNKDTTVKITKSFLDEKLVYRATDSITADLNNKKAYLYNNAEVYYENMVLKAGFIEIDFGKKLVIAKGIADSTSKIVQLPVFEQAEDKFLAGEIIYNFETKKGKIKNVITQQGDGYIHGENIKKDSSNVYYVATGKYTTCDLAEPHFYISAKKIKVIPDDKTITGPAELYIADIPTPLVLPFGYFPNKRGRQSGILMPTYGERNNFGFFLQDGGFYFGMSEYVDLALRGTIFGNGSFGASAASSYNKRYRYNGALDLRFSRFIQGDADLSDSLKLNDFKINWRHTEDPKAHPNSRFSASVNAGSAFYNKFSGNPTGNYLQNQYASNISYSKTFPGTPFNFSVNARHNQNTTIRSIDIDLPEVNASMGRIYPFKNKNSIKNNWYDKVGVSANLQAANKIKTTDSLILKKNIFDQMQNGVGFSAPISTSFNILQFFTVSPSISTNSNLYFKTIEKRYNADTKKIITDTINNIKAVSYYSASVSANTQVYGDYFFNTKHLKQIRHVASPSLSISYHPDFSEGQYGYYKSVRDSTGKKQDYSIFETGMYGYAPKGQSASLGFSLGNTLEAKTKSTSDSGAVFKKIKLLDYFGSSISYNMAAKEFQWSSVNVNARTRLLDKIDVNSSANFDPYQSNPQNERINYLEWENGRLLRFVNTDLSLGTTLRSKEKKTKDTNNTNITKDELDDVAAHPEQYIDFDVPWTLTMNYMLRYTPPAKLVTDSKIKKKLITQTFNFNGDVNLTKKWRIGISSGYDFNAKKTSITSINIYRDLHCWEMHFNWIVGGSGFRNSFLLNINVKSAMLKDLKLKKQSKDSNAIMY